MVPHQDFDLYLEKAGPDRYRSCVFGDNGVRIAENSFELAVEKLKMREDLKRLEAYSISSAPARENFHVLFGQQLYRSALGGPVGELFASRLAQCRADGAGLRLAVRVDAAAPELMTIPWELAHDGQDFLVTRTETPISRLPVGVKRSARRPLERTLRMLVVVSSPLDLPPHLILNTEKEQEVILAALDKLQRKRLIDIDFCEDSTLDTIQDYLNEQDYDILHFTGHGIFNEEKGHGEILLEDDQGSQKPISTIDFSAIIRNHPSLRLVVLSACQSARTANNTAYADMASRLAVQGTPAVLAMQYSVLDEAAILFADKFYGGLASNRPIDIALTQARLALRLAGQTPSGERIDFATPVLFLSDPACVNTGGVKAEAEEVDVEALLDLNTVSVMDRGFVGRRRELRRIRRSFVTGRQRAFIIHGLGGMGKSVLATRAATKLQKSFRGVKAVRMTATIRAEDILADLNAYLNLSGITAFNQIIHAQAPVSMKVGALAQIFTKFPCLIIFDNFEDVLIPARKPPDGQAQAGSGYASEIGDPGLAEFFEVFVKSIASGSRLLFTSRYDFDPTRGRLTAEIEHIPLGELPFAVAVQCMNNHDVLSVLPVVPAPQPQQARPAGGDRPGAPHENNGAAPPITKHELYRRIGGHPYTIDIFARRATVTSVGDVWLEVQDVEREVIEFTLLDRIFSQLPERAQTLLIRASELHEPGSLEMIQWLMGEDEGSASVDAEMQSLMGWGMISREETKDGALYPMHALVRDHARHSLKTAGVDKVALQKRIGRFWEIQINQADDQASFVFAVLRAREYYYEARDYEQAWQLLRAIIELLSQWGYFERLIRMLSDSIATTAGVSQGIAKFQLAILYHDMGDLTTALRLHEEVLELWLQLGMTDGIPVQNQEIGAIYHSLGKFDKAREAYNQNIALRRHAKPDPESLANSLYQLALLDMDENKLDAAKAGLEETLELSIQLHNLKDISKCLRELGQIDYKLGNYEPALQKVLQSLAMNEQINNKQGLGHCHLLIGKIFLESGKRPEAIASFEKALAIFDSMGMSSSVAMCLHSLAVIHRLDGNHRESIEKAYVAMRMFAEYGDHNQQAVSLFLVDLKQQLGSRFDEISSSLGWRLNVTEQADGNMEIGFHPIGAK